MQILDWKALDDTSRKKALERPAMKHDAKLAQRVASILREVQENGDDALRAYNAQFDGAASGADIRVPQTQLKQAVESLAPELREAIERAKQNIACFHEAQKPRPIEVETMPGVRCGMQWRPLDTVGLYVPGGTAPLFSTVLMLAVPAKLAGCRRIALCSPPQKNGKGIHMATLAAATLCGVEEVFAMGGAQAIAAMAYGTQSVPKVDKIFGPGNAYVTSAKQQVAQDPKGAALDMPAGPSEVLVWADPPADPAWVAADLLAQAEHDTLSQVLCVTTSAELARSVAEQVATQAGRLPRHDIVRKSLESARIIVAPDRATALEIVNAYAPEHLILQTNDAEKLVPEIRHASAIFVGPWTPESAGDYASGANHVLPTYGYARAYSGLSLPAFMKSLSVQTLTREGLNALGPAIVAMAEAEGLEAHAEAVRVRLR
ncbi:MAG: histidinol dehydrogenase [Bdellovibrionales bacterium]